MPGPVEGSPATSRSFEPGVAQVLSGLGQGDGWTDYYHTDHLGTTRRMTGPNGSVIASDSTMFSAFGERISGTLDGTEDRYGYVGAWGYQRPVASGFGDSYANFPFLHVGARYYDPASGRFLQRDPIGVDGGANVYSYVGGSPLRFVDPSGLDWQDVILEPIVKIIGPENVLKGTGGEGHVPVMDPGTAQDVVLVTAGLVSIAAPGGAALKAGKIRWLPNAKGIEVTITKNLRIGWHRFKLNGKDVFRPHYHRRRVGADGQTLTCGGIGRHRPWE